MNEPSRDWSERIPPDEAEHHARLAVVVTDLQAHNDAAHGRGRAFHRRGILALEGEIEILGGLAAPLAQGLFATPGRLPCQVRLSSGATGVQPDNTPDIRGFAIKIAIPEAPGALGMPTRHQDFLLIQREAFGFANSADFIAFVQAFQRGTFAVLAFFVRRFGFFAGLGRVRRLLGSLNQPFSGFATERFHTTVPFAYGPYAARARLLPAASDPAPTPVLDLAADMRRRLAAGPLTYEFQVQLFVSEALTPIEDATEAWPESAAPFHTVARLTLRAPPEGAAGDALTAAVEGTIFDPWEALVAHRPLGDVMRARKVAYFASAKARGAIG